MPAYRSRTTTHGRNMAGARGLWRATGMKNEDFGKPIIAVVNSFTQFVPGHVHLQETLCDDVARAMLAHPKVRAVCVSTMKPDVYTDCEGVGVEVFQIKEEA